MTKLLRSAGLTLFCLFVALALSFSSASITFWDNTGDAILVDELVNSMNDEELLGQVFFLGYVGTTPSPDIIQWIQERNLGGVKIFTRNVTSLSALSADIRDLQLLSQSTRLKLPLLVATDQEGGWVKHIRKEASTTGGNLSLGAGGVPRDAFMTGFYIGEELKALGINMNFAPTLDVYSNPGADAVGARAFSSDPRETGILGVAYLQGQKKAGVIGTGKHFPGHGGADLDSHGFLPEIDVDLETMWNRELLPYRFAVKEGIPAVMSAHVAFPRVTGKKEPASLSEFFLKDILRARLCFEGIVITDDMEMNGVLMNGDGIPAACKKALMAGNDMILVSHTPSIQHQVWQNLLKEMKTNNAFREQVKTSVRRIVNLKIATFKGVASFPFLPDPESVASRIPAPAAPDFFFESACRAVTLVRGGLVPYTPSPGERLIIISQYSDFIQEGEKRYPMAESLSISWTPMYTPRLEDKERVYDAAKNCDTIIFCLANPNSLGILMSLRHMQKKIIVISALTPVYLHEVPWVETAIAVYGDAAASFQAGFAVLKGDFAPEGELPVHFTGQ